MEFCKLLKTLELLVQKYPDPRRKSSLNKLIQGPAQAIHPVLCDDVDESLIMKALILSKGVSV